MAKPLKKAIRYTTSKQGMTLVEVMVSLIILSIILVSFMTFFIQSAKTNNLSENITDATFIAQKQMEEIYALSSNESFNNGMTKLQTDLHFSMTTNDDGEHFLTKEISGYYVEMNVKIDGNLIVKVYDNLINKKLKAQMQTILSWKKENGDPSGS